MRHVALSLALATLASCATAPTITTAPVVAAERAFAARAAEVGWVPAFREFAAADGLMPGPEGYVSAPEQLERTPDDGNRTLAWWPAYAGIARSGDMGFTAGPASFDDVRTPRIYYFTIWRRQADGSWKWIYDGGPGPVSDPASLALGAEPVSLPLAARGLGAETATEQVNALESQGDLTAYLAPDAHVYRPGRPRAVGGSDARANIAFPASPSARRLTRAEASAAGDMVFTLGEANWAEEGQERRGFFARVWQLRPDGWRIVYDHLIIRRPPQG